jgi:hypothetical protein
MNPSNATKRAARKVLFFFSSKLQTPLSNKEMELILSTLVYTKVTRRSQITPMIVGLLIGLRPDDKGLKKKIKSMYKQGNGSHKKTKESFPEPNHSEKHESIPQRDYVIPKTCIASQGLSAPGCDSPRTYVQVVPSDSIYDQLVQLNPSLDDALIMQHIVRMELDSSSTSNIDVVVLRQHLKKVSDPDYDGSLVPLLQCNIEL